MFTQRLQGWARGMARHAAQIFVKTPITPNMLTLFGLVLNGVVALLLGTGHLVAGGVMLIAAGLFDMLDGALAKITSKMSTFGAFLDSVVDRYSEAVVFLGLLLYYYFQPTREAVIDLGPIHATLPAEEPVIEIILIYVILVGSMMISYARARAGSLHIQNEVGILARPERIILLAIGLLFQTVLLLPVLGLLAIGTHYTAIQRIIYVWQVTSSTEENK